MATVEINLPDGLAREAKAQGLLSPEFIESLLREEVRRRRVDRLFGDAEKLAGFEATALTEEEVEAEIQAARKERRASDASRG
jgi:hypothetical protein